jgi:hypothetical protein
LIQAGGYSNSRASRTCASRSIKKRMIDRKLSTCGGSNPTAGGLKRQAAFPDQADLDQEVLQGRVTRLRRAWRCGGTAG